MGFKCWIVGLPNVGKSSFLKSITNARPKVADYPFTTLYPNLGVVSYDNYKEIVIADIPGLIKNASKGVGLGIKFLGHIEKCNILLHFLDSGKEGIVDDYKTIRHELKSYGSNLDKKKEIIVLTRSDLINKMKVKNQMKKLNAISNNKILNISIYDRGSIISLKKLLLLEKNKIVKMEIKKWSP